MTWLHAPALHIASSLSFTNLIEVSRLHKRRQHGSSSRPPERDRGVSFASYECCVQLCQPSRYRAQVLLRMLVALTISR